MPIDEQRILLTQAAPGMVLSRTVALLNKVPLCARGTALTEIIISRLMARGIKRVYVQGHPLPAPTREAYIEVMTKLAERFSRVRHEPIMVNLQKIVERALTRRT